ncbi:guanylate kinase [Ehrlichia chaffeensis str. Heartland]|uniref:Guanylate kinase n=1 Tax=Ehrlichia chaffeensis (strain ATCC CRL-10679 / Arkansas) TaxID=205920 RepID=KGUA_EHRCR|nr:guanylate kinase [Ehrlichia chaffeensis]Q2GHE0.1 RecName: Full=Guanylate kinase; AltName: Full=GMP kinase [Ehrlichia chaffeensis str. Arkansas]ABD45409.1 guanylate kinase [Ehrlichia chaffeensis str. Arkansas]AHX03437.1 guanylate kinase [Ehrlichia chaffeensis str. Heartland]AHX05842.1 guanylate kinase [Ehrlichia chaffeensis str. Jax]AHX06834.1 guanylate kinase [Ehrlichia chaffeensis str. Liberty]AHX07201.1 guanylate kinase [Ehrlichia chaffeensis str. Osceola]
MNDSLKSRGIMLVISSPSGGGKTTISHLLINELQNDLVRSISVTTREPRDGEINGKDYFFVTEPEFINLCNTNQMLEYAKVFGNYYGIPRKFVTDNIANGVSVLFSIDWQGAFKLIDIMREHVVSIFILPPSMEELQRRLYNRSGESDVINKRLGEAAFEISHCYRYDYVIVNHDIEQSVYQIKCIFTSEKLKTQRRVSLKQFIDNCIR